MFLKTKVKWYSSIAFFLVTACSIIVITFFVLAFYFTYFKLENFLEQKIDEGLLEETASFSGILKNNGFKTLLNAVKLEIETDREQEKFAKLHSGSLEELKTFIPDGMENIASNRKLFEDVLNNNKSTIETVYLDKKRFRVIYSQLGPNCLIQFGISKAEDDNLLIILKKRFWACLLIIIPLIIMICWFISKIALKDIKVLTSKVAEIRKGNLDIRMPISPHANELTNLSHAFNSMLDFLQELLKNQMEISNNIAHDLRSPLTRICGEIEVILNKPRTNKEYTKTLHSIIEDINEMQAMIKVMLDIASMETNVVSNMVAVNIKKLIYEVADLFIYSAEEKNISLDITCNQSVAIFASPQCLKRAISNVLDNSIKYTLPGGTIIIKVEKTFQFLNITISDSGIGIDEKDIKNIFNRFYRTEVSRTSCGNGLGLCLVESIIKAHGGSVSVESHRNVGTSFFISLPI